MSSLIIQQKTIVFFCCFIFFTLFFLFEIRRIMDGDSSTDVELTTPEQSSSQPINKTNSKTGFDAVSVWGCLQSKHDLWTTNTQLEIEMASERERKLKILNAYPNDNLFCWQINEGILENGLVAHGSNALRSLFPESKWMQDVDKSKEEMRVKEFGCRLVRPKLEIPTSFNPDNPIDLRFLVCKMLPHQNLYETLIPMPSSWVGHQLFTTRTPYVESLLCLLIHNVAPTVSVIIDIDKKLYCHFMVMTLMSSYFNRQPDSHLLCLPACIISMQDFVRAYRWMFKPVKTLTIRQLMELTRVANYLQIDELLCQCWRLIFDLLNSTDKILTIYVTAKRVCGLLERKIIPYLGPVWLPFTASTEFATLSFYNMKNVLQAERLAVNSEMETLYSVVLWLDFDWTTRKSFASDLMDLIQFDIMPYSFLVALDKINDSTPSFIHIISCPRVHQNILKSLDKVQGNLNKYKGWTQPTNRSWIYDPCCKYHHTQSCKTYRFFDFSDFLDYIKFLQVSGRPYSHRVQSAYDPKLVCCDRN